VVGLPLKQRQETAIDEADPYLRKPTSAVSRRGGRLTQSDFDLGARKKITSSTASLLSEPAERSQSPMGAASVELPPAQSLSTLPRHSSRSTPMQSDHGPAAEGRRGDVRPAVGRGGPPPTTVPKHGAPTSSRRTPPSLMPEDEEVTAATSAYDPFEALPPPEESMYELEEGVGDEDDDGEVRMLTSQEALNFGDHGGHPGVHYPDPSLGHHRHHHHDTRPTDL